MANKFKIGDKVKVIRVLPEYQKLLGAIGEIASIDEEWDFPYEVRFDNEEFEKEVESGWLQSLFAEVELAFVDEKIKNVEVVDDKLEPVPVEEHVYIEIMNLLKYIDENLPQGRATSMVKTKLDEARLWLGEVR